MNTAVFKVFAKFDVLTFLNIRPTSWTYVAVDWGAYTYILMHHLENMGGRFQADREIFRNSSCLVKEKVVKNF
jgi:hypothetical protein